MVTNFYFVDEAGDGTIFNRNGRSIIGDQGCSKYFILGFVEIKDPILLENELKELRQKMVEDPYFSNIPSMRPNGKKTALLFHAKDDLPEIRKEVFSVLVRHDISFFAVIKDKRKVLDYAHQRRMVEPHYRYHPNELYDFLTRRLFKQRLHKEGKYTICFASRGSSDRTRTLQAALEHARDKFCAEKNIKVTSALEICEFSSKDSLGLQAVDYYLWALQRLYERHEDRYFNYIAKQVGLIIDLDDQSVHPYGSYYNKNKPLTVNKLREASGI